MPAGKRRQSNAMLYTLITFVGLFVVATTAAVIYYVKAEELTTRDKERQDETNRLVSQEELRSIGAIVGNRLPGQSNLGTVVAHLDQMVKLVTGGPVRTTSAEVKVAEVRQVIQPLLEKARAYITLPGVAVAADAGAAKKADPNKPADPNAAAPQVALAGVISDLLMKLEQTTSEKTATAQQLNTLKQRFDDAVKIMKETEQKLGERVVACEQQVTDIKTNYDKLKTSVDQTSQEQIGAFQADLEKARAQAKDLNENLLKTQAEFNVAQLRLQGALAQVSEIKPAPDKEAPAFQPDGNVSLVDEAAGVIYIDLGSDDRVYQGLTFSVYDRSAGIPRDGKPKAQVEVFQIDKKSSAARVLSSDTKNPITTGDLVANLIWDPARQNQFIVVGDFDLNGDGKPDFDGVTKIEGLIQRWGGAVSKEVTPLTDYVILGTEPPKPLQPTAEAQTADPTALEKYNAAKAKNDEYNQIRQRAEALWVPMFNYDRFLYFTGYANQTNRPGAL
ncbi:MAG: hypothetical protein M1376_09425 [Planctomycetes bacterium]|nr:hypothetical protein [Planctomycetota bacterium]